MVGQVILVCIEVGREVTDYALEWAVENVIKPMDSLVLLAIIPSHDYNQPPVTKITPPHHNSKGLFSRFLKKRSVAKNDVSDKVGFIDDGRDIPQRVYDVCAQMIHHLFSLHKVVKVHTEVKVVAYTPVGSVAMIATELHARWVILDQRLNNEADCCLKQYLNCNVVLVDGSFHKILRSVNFPLTMKIDQEKVPTMADMLGSFPAYNNQVYNTNHSASDLTPNSNSTQKTSSFYSTHSSTTNEPVSKYTLNRSKQYPESQQLNQIPTFGFKVPLRSVSGPIEVGTDGNRNRLRIKEDMTRNVEMKTESVTMPYAARKSVDFRRTGQKERSQNDLGQKTTRRISFSHANPPTIDRTSSVRRDISLSLKKPPTPPPLCSVCKHSVPVLGRSPKRFSYEEIKKATDGFSETNFLAEGGFGQVYRGVLSDGQIVAVKQRKTVSAQGAAEFCSEVEVLSCAQHKNLVMLIGYCIEEWLLVYEFACNGSLDKHLYGSEEGEVMSWDNRIKVARGAARALRYLHEDCRVGCIVHRDFRPNNILLTHDFEPMVGDFGLARWQADGQLEEETRVVGAFGYLAPEYTQTGLITEKTDIYAFGIVLLEILTGIKATEFSKTSRQQYFPEWGRRLLEEKVCAEIVDRKLGNKYDVKEVEYMMHAARLCISPDPDHRPKMSKVLRILEGNVPLELDNHRQEQSTSIFQKPRFDSHNSSKDTLSKRQKTHIRSITKLSSLALKLENQQDAILKPRTPPRQKFISNEYQEYLQGSLQKHIQGFKN
ncbi:inactive protein kinase SELMODRAFT_444075-like [Rutidosis leptorrhynchoides]|uniref:inactive protein kinase SELMODRAFT_444075-like n=1 Tax=Rutidosis leptorrhynchoides TaxID=125765 RepID=UPI003A992087